MKSDQDDVLVSRTTISSKLMHKIMKLVQHSESLITVWLPGSGRTRFGQYLQDNNLTKSNLAGFLQNNENHLFIYLDQKIGESLDEYLDNSLEVYSGEKSYRKSLLKLISKEIKLTFIIDNANFDEKFFRWISSIRSISSSKISFILLCLERDFEEMRSNLARDFSFLQQNVVEIPYLDKENIEYWVKTQAESLGLELEKSKMNEIMHWSGSVPAILKSSVRILEKYNLNWSKAIESEEMHILIWSIWERYSDNLKSKIISYKLPINSYHLENINLLNENEPIGEWVKTILRKVVNESEVKISKDKVSYHSINISDLLSEKENSLLLLLCNQKSVTRDQVFALSKDKEYSDWAIDQAVYRLRKKLESVFYRKDFIQTVKGKGYKLTNIKIVRGN